MKKEILDKESNSYAFNRGYKLYLEGRGICCSYCRYHRGENEERKAYKSWKLKTKKRKQWAENSKGDDRRDFLFRDYISFYARRKFNMDYDEWSQLRLGDWDKISEKFA